MEKSEENRSSSNPLFPPRKGRGGVLGEDKSAEWISCVPAVFHRCLGQNDVTFAGRGRRRRLVGSGVLASFEKMKMRPPDAGKKSVDKAGRQTFDGEQPPV